MTNLQQYSTYSILGISFISLAYHALILTQIVPFEYAWGGQLKTVEEMYVFEVFSVAVTLIAAALVASYAGYIKTLPYTWLYKTVFTLFMVLFALNTLGNIVAETTFESVVFTPLTAISSIAYGILLFSKKPIKVI